MDVMRRLLLVLVLSTVVQAQVQPPATASGSLASTSSVTLNVSSYASVAFQLTGTWSATVTFEGSVDGVTFQTINVTPTNSSSSVTSASANGVWVGSVGGLKYVRARVSAYTSGTVVATIQTALSGGGSGGGGGGGSAPSGTIGAAVPSTASPAGFKDASGNLAYVTLDGSGNVPVAVTGAGSGGTSAVDGSAYTAGATAGTPLMGARDDAGTTACAEDKNCIARLTSARALMVDASATTQPVSGTVAATESGTWTVQPGNTANTTAWKVDGSAVTQPVSGTVTANMGTVTADPFGANADGASATGSISAKLRFIAGTGIPITGTVTVGSHAVTNAGTFAVQDSVADGANVVLGAKADAKSAATDTTAISIMQVLKQISASVQAPPSQAVTNAGTFATQSAITAASGSIASGAIASGAIASGAIASGAIASGAVASGAYAADSASFGVGATGAAPPAKGVSLVGVGSGATGGLLVGITACDLNKPITITSATTTLMVTGISGRQVRICALHMLTAIANNVAVVEGTGATCGTGTAGITGGATAANGYNFAANGGIALGSGLGEVAATATTGDSVCIITSAAGPLSGFIKYAIY